MAARITRLPINGETYLDRTVVDRPLDEVPSRGMFLLRFSNKRKQLHGLERHDAEGTLYSSGHVHVDTQLVQVHDFRSLQQMMDYFNEYGDCHISWLRGE